MPELPEVETIKRQLQKSVVGKTVSDVSVYLDKMVKVGPGRISSVKIGSRKSSKEFAKLLRGKKIIAVSRRAKYLIIELADRNRAQTKEFLIGHLRMSGQMIVLQPKLLKTPLSLSIAKTAPKQTLPSKHTHVELVFTDGSKLFYNDTRQFGHLRFVDAPGFAQVFLEQDLGPEPLTLTLKDFQEIVKAHPQRRVKDFLLDQSVIAGIGNIYADETLFRSGIRPQHKVGKLSQAEIKALSMNIKKVLEQAIKAGGSSLEYFLKINGAAGKFSNQHQVYGRAGLPCLRCGHALISAKVGSRTSTYCRYCQK